MILVTGASGFIGRYVVKKLAENNQDVIALTRSATEYHSIGNEMVVESSLLDKDRVVSILRGKAIDICVHLAWEGIPDYSYDMSRRNLLYGLNLLDICKEVGVENLVITGSCWEYKDPIGNTKVDSELDYSNSFKSCKNSLHALAHNFCSENGIQMNWLRLFYVYGPGQRHGSLIPYIIDSFKRGEQPLLNGAYNQNDFVYVEDVAEAIARCVDGPNYPETLNVGSGHGTRVLDIVRKVAKKYDFNLNEDSYENRGGTSFYADYDEMKEMYGFEAKTSIGDGIERMIELA